MSEQIVKVRLRRAAALLLLVAGLACSAAVTLASFDKRMIEHTVENSRLIEVEFQAAAKYVDAARSSNRRLPTESELLAWSQSQAGAHYPLYLAGGAEGAAGKLGRQPSGAYTLAIWRGERTEYYAPWSGKSTLTLDDTEFYLFGSRSADHVLAGLLALATLLSAAWIWSAGFRRKP